MAASALNVTRDEKLLVIGVGKVGARMTKLIQRIRVNHHPVPMKALAEELQCDRATVKRMIRQLVKEHGLPIVSSRAGYAWRPPVLSARPTEQCGQ